MTCPDRSFHIHLWASHQINRHVLNDVSELMGIFAASETFWLRCRHEVALDATNPHWSPLLSMPSR